MDIDLIHCKASQPQDAEGCVSSDMHSIFKNGSREGCFSNRKNTCCSTRHSKPDKPDPHVETSPPRSDRLS